MCDDELGQVRAQIGPAPFDMILLAPPESADHKWGRPRWEMRGYEPKSATIAGPTGLEGYQVRVPIHTLTKAGARRVESIPARESKIKNSTIRWHLPPLPCVSHLIGCCRQAVMDSLALCDPPLLVPGGWLLVRANSRSHHAVRQLFQKARESFEETEVVRDERGVKCGLILRYTGGGPRARGAPAEEHLGGVKMRHFAAFEDALGYLLAAVGRARRGEGGGEEPNQDGSGPAAAAPSHAPALPAAHPLRHREQGLEEGSLSTCSREPRNLGGGGVECGEGGVAPGKEQALSNGKVIWLLGEMLQRQLTVDEKQRARKSGFRVAPAKFCSSPHVDLGHQ